MSFDGSVRSKKVFSEYSHNTLTHLDVVVEVLEVQISFTSELYFDKEYIEFCEADIMFDIPYATNFCIRSTFQWWNILVRRECSGRILGIWRINIVWWGMLFLTHYLSENCIDIVNIRTYIGILRISFLHIRLHLSKPIRCFLT